MRIVVTGASGQLGAYVLRALVGRGKHEVLPWTRHGGDLGRLKTRAVDLTDPTFVESALETDRPGLIVHAAAMASADAVRRDPALAWATNVEMTAQLARWCLQHERRLIFTSTDMVFDGTRSWYREDDAPAPMLEYGRTKAAAETSVLEVPGGLVARISLLYGPSRAGRKSFFDHAIARLRAGEPQAFFADEYRTPLHYATAAQALILLAEREARGIVHVGGRERLSRYELMLRVARVLEIDSSLVQANRRRDVPAAEPRPADLSLDTSRLSSLLPELDRPPIETSIGQVMP
jgi:dTDP-4-dehydrorhamnose reductase